MLTNIWFTAHFAFPEQDFFLYRKYTMLMCSSPPSVCMFQPDIHNVTKFIHWLNVAYVGIAWQNMQCELPVILNSSNTQKLAQTNGYSIWKFEEYCRLPILGQWEIFDAKIMKLKKKQKELFVTKAETTSITPYKLRRNFKTNGISFKYMKLIYS